MFGALLCTALVIAMFDPLARHAFGERFLGAIAYNSINGVTDGSTEGTIGVTPYLPVLAGILAGNVVLTIIIWVPGVYACATRSMIAWSFDRVAPDRLGYVSQRFHTQVVAIWTIFSGAVVLTWLIAYRQLAFLTFVELQGAIWVVVHVAAMVFPYRRPAIYRNSRWRTCGCSGCR
jgi:amino acid transporter